MYIEDVLIIVARDQPELLARLTAIYAHASTVEVRVDRREGQPWTEAGDRPDRRAPPSPDTDIHDHGFIVVLRS